MPGALRDKPEIPPHLLFYWQCFMDLAHDRQVFMGGVTQISYMALSRWAEDHEVAGDALDRLTSMVRALDRVWVDDVDRRTKAAAKAG